jgi:dGTPase
VRVADIMAYVNHDMDDALRAGMLHEDDLPAHLRESGRRQSSQRINAMVGDLVAETLARNDGRLHLSERMNSTITDLRTFLYDNVYRNYRVHNEFERRSGSSATSIGYFLEHELPEHGIGSCCRLRNPVQSVEEEQQRHRRVCDFIAGMTDRYALTLYSQIFMPKPWSVL